MVISFQRQLGWQMLQIYISSFISSNQLMSISITYFQLVYILASFYIYIVLRTITYLFNIYHVDKDSVLGMIFISLDVLPSDQQQSLRDSFLFLLLNWAWAWARGLFGGMLFINRSGLLTYLKNQPWIDTNNFEFTQNQDRKTEKGSHVQKNE